MREGVLLKRGEKGGTRGSTKMKTYSDLSPVSSSKGTTTQSMDAYEPWETRGHEKRGDVQKSDPSLLEVGGLP